MKSLCLFWEALEKLVTPRRDQNLIMSRRWRGILSKMVKIVFFFKLIFVSVFVFNFSYNERNVLASIAKALQEMRMG